MLTFQIFDGKYFDGWSLSFTKHCIALKFDRLNFDGLARKPSKTSKFSPVKISRYTVLWLYILKTQRVNTFTTLIPFSTQVILYFHII